LKILVTGITGVLGSHLVPSLTRQHEIFALVRNASKRKDDLAHCGVALDHIIEGDLEKNNLGLNHITLDKIHKLKIDCVIHGAGSVKFDDKYFAETMNVNKGGTERIIEFARSMNIPNFHFISTAYAPYERNPQKK